MSPCAAPAAQGPSRKAHGARPEAGKAPLIGGLHKLSCVDYPGRPAAVLFLQGCNFRCPYCHNAGLIPGRASAPLRADEALDFLRRRAGTLTAAVISGGEPCLHSALPDLCRNIKSLGYALKLDSNGSRPDVLAELLERQLVDYVALDLKTAPEGYAALCPEKDAGAALAQSLELLRQSGTAHEVRSTCAAPFVSAQTLPAMAGLAGPSPWYLQKAVISDAMAENGVTALPPEEIEALAARAKVLGADVRVR